MSDAYNTNAVWCDVLAEELARAGVRDLVLCPGGRSAALALRLDGDPAFRVLVHTDERSGGFFALGAARATGAPVAVCTTSGSAVANVLPALLEADAGDVPLVLLTCDRPRTVRGAGAPQTTDQLALCAGLVRAAVDLDDPGAAALATLRSLVAGLLAAATRPGAEGPVQLNVPLAGVFDSTEPEQGPLPAKPPPAPAPRLAGEPRAGAADAARAVAGLALRPGLRGLVVAGPGSPLSREEADRLARATGFPVVADASTGLRAPAIAHVVCEGDALVLHPRLAGEPVELVVRLGEAPLSQLVHAYLARQGCPVLRLDAHAVERDFLSPAFRLLRGPDAGALDELGRALGPGDPAWLALWLELSARARERLDAAVAELPWCESLAAAIACRAEGFDFLHLANSLPVRHGNLHVGPGTRALPVFANRGLNGIDGTLGTFLGELRGGGRGLLLAGDQAALHDLPALAAARADGLRGCVCVLANGGGRLFDLLPLSRLRGHVHAIRNPAALDLGAVAAAFGLPFRRAADEPSFREALAEAAAAESVSVVEAAVGGDGIAEEIPALVRTMLS